MWTRCGGLKVGDLAISSYINKCDWAFSVAVLPPNKHAFTAKAVWADFMDNPISMDELGVAHDFGNLYLTMDHTSPGSMMIYV